MEKFQIIVGGPLIKLCQSDELYEVEIREIQSVILILDLIQSNFGFFFKFYSEDNQFTQDKVAFKWCSI